MKGKIMTTAYSKALSSAQAAWDFLDLLPGVLGSVSGGLRDQSQEYHQRWSAAMSAESRVREEWEKSKEEARKKAEELSYW